ncbi:MAG: hypothetical protein P8Y54_12315 [Xanthomonadales bacterium]
MKQPDEFDSYDARKAQLEHDYRALLSRPNEPLRPGNGIFARWRHPVLTREHAPLHWRYDFDPQRNPFLQERLGVNAAFNAGAIQPSAFLWYEIVCLPTVP